MLKKCRRPFPSHTLTYGTTVLLYILFSTTIDKPRTLSPASQILEPDLRQAADEVLQTQEDLKALRKEAKGIWSDVQRAVSGVGKETAPDEHNLDTQAGLEWKDIKRDAAKLAKGVFGEVSTLRSKLYEDGGSWCRC